ncbi:MAG: hypothetical protein ACC700_13400 [Anaerolineales bacterium]
MSVNLPSFPAMPAVPPPRDYWLADWYHERIHTQLNRFVESLSDDETYTSKVVLQSGEVIVPSSFGYHNPNMLVVNGRDENGNEVVLLCPHWSAQIVFTKIKKADLAEPEQRPLGFQVRRTGDDVEPSSDQSVAMDFLDE